MDYPKRKRLRLPDYDYSSEGVYFLTLCTKDRAPILSSITKANEDGETIAAISLTHLGAIVQEYILSIFFDVEKERAKINREVEEARKKRKEERKKRPEKAKKAIRQDKEKYAEESKSFDGDMTEEQRKRLEKARALDREKYGDK